MNKYNYGVVHLESNVTNIRELQQIEKWRQNEKVRAGLSKIVHKIENNQKWQLDYTLENFIKDSQQLVLKHQVKNNAINCKTEQDNRPKISSILKFRLKTQQPGDPQKAIKNFENQINKLSTPFKQEQQKCLFKIKRQTKTPIMKTEHSPKSRVREIKKTLKFNSNIYVSFIDIIEKMSDFEDFTINLKIPHFHQSFIKKNIINFMDEIYQDAEKLKRLHIQSGNEDIQLNQRLKQQCDEITNIKQFQQMITFYQNLNDSETIQQIYCYYLIPSKTFRHTQFQWLIDLINIHASEQSQFGYPILHLYNQRGDLIREILQIEWSDQIIYASKYEIDQSKQKLITQVNSKIKEQQIKQGFVNICSIFKEQVRAKTCVQRLPQLDQKKIERISQESWNKNDLKSSIETKSSANKINIHLITLDTFSFQRLQKIYPKISQQQAEYIVSEFNKIYIMHEKCTICQVSKHDLIQLNQQICPDIIIKNFKFLQQMNQQQQTSFFQALGLQIQSSIVHSIISFECFASLLFLIQGIDFVEIEFLKNYFDPFKRVYIPRQEIKIQLHQLSNIVEQEDNKFNEMFVNMMIKAFESLGLFQNETVLDCNQFSNSYQQGKGFFKYLIKWIMNAFIFEKKTTEEDEMYEWEKIIN